MGTCVEMAKVPGLLFSKTSFFKNLGPSSTPGYPPNTGNNQGAPAEMQLLHWMEWLRLPSNLKLLWKFCGWNLGFYFKKRIDLMCTHHFFD
jgi:hypothetical protein